MREQASVRYREQPAASLLTAPDELHGSGFRRFERELRRNEHRRLLLVLDLRGVTQVGPGAVAFLRAAQVRARRERRCVWVLPNPIVLDAVDAAGASGLVEFAPADELHRWLVTDGVAD